MTELPVTLILVPEHDAYLDPDPSPDTRSSMVAAHILILAAECQRMADEGAPWDTTAIMEHSEVGTWEAQNRGRATALTWRELSDYWTYEIAQASVIAWEGRCGNEPIGTHAKPTTRVVRYRHLRRQIPERKVTDDDK